MVGLTTLEVYKSFFNIAEQNNKFDLFTDNFDEFSFEESKDELEEILSISDITLFNLQHEILGARNIQAYMKIRSEKSRTDGFIIFLMGYARSLFRDLQSYLRSVVGLDEDFIQLILNQYKSNFLTCEISTRIYSNKDISKAVYKMGDHEGAL